MAVNLKKKVLKLIVIRIDDELKRVKILTILSDDEIELRLVITDANDDVFSLKNHNQNAIFFKSIVNLASFI